MSANTTPKWPDNCACGHSGYQHHARFMVSDGTPGFGPEQFCGSKNPPCECTEYRAAVARPA